jgi:hypothetical protein
MLTGRGVVVKTSNMRLKHTNESRDGLDRRALLRRAGIGAGLVGIGWAFGREGREDEVRAARFHGGDILGRGDAHQAWYRFKFIGQPVMDAQVVFLLGLATAGLTDVGEVLDTATRIVPGSEASWFEQWCATAERVRGYGDEAEARGHQASAASHWYRAGAYYRAGLMRYARRADPRIERATRVSLALHDRALLLRGYDSHEVAIPHGEGTLHGRVHYAGDAQGPLLILHQGMHAWPEDTMWAVDGALRRGYHVLTFHGPGQGASLRLGGHVFRPDWEVPVGDVLDFAAGDDRFDPERTILMGLSFGGYLAPRAAAFDDRIRALVADPGVVSWADSTMRHFQSMPGLLDLHAAGPSAFDRAIDIAGAAMPDARWYFEDATWKHGVRTPHELIDELRRYDNAGGVGRLRCKTLVIEGTAEDASPGEARRFYDALSAPKHWLELDDSTASQVHCQGGNQLLVQARLFDWLDEEVAS